MTDLVVVEKLEGWEKLKTLVLDSVSSPITKRVYNMALNEFLAWFQQAPRPGFTKATVRAWRVSLEARGLGSSSIIIYNVGDSEVGGRGWPTICRSKKRAPTRPSPGSRVLIPLVCGLISRKSWIIIRARTQWIYPLAYLAGNLMRIL